MRVTEPSLLAEVSRFLEALTCRYAENSIKIFRKALSRFERFCEGGLPQGLKLNSVREVTESVMEDFRLWLWGCSLAESTTAMVLRAVRSFVTWSYDVGLSFWDGRSFKVATPQDEPPPPPVPAVVKRLLSLPDKQTPLGLRDSLILELLYGLGLRRTECCSLQLESLDLCRETLWVKGKGGWERLLPVWPGLKQLAQDYLYNARPVLCSASEVTALLVNRNGGELSGASLRQVVRKYGARLGLRISPHCLRRACATHLVEAGMELAQLQQLLGHQCLDSTKRYAQIRWQALEKEYRSKHPRAKLPTSEVVYDV